MVFVPVTEFLIEHSPCDVESVEYAPRRRNHWQAKSLAEKLGFDCPIYPAEDKDGYAVFIREVKKTSLGVKRICTHEEGPFSQYGDVESFEVVRERITFSNEGYTLDFLVSTESLALSKSQVGDMYRNGIGRFADHR